MLADVCRARPSPNSAPGDEEISGTREGPPRVTFDLDARIADDGELLLRGPHVFAGYFRDDEATKAALSDDGWLRTGDVFSARDDGWRVIGRKKEMFISGGENVYPAEIEAALAAHPSVIASAVVGAPDETWGEAGVAFVVADDVEAETLRTFLRSRLAAFKVPREVRLVDELPRTASGKIDRSRLAALLKKRRG